MYVYVCIYVCTDGQLCMITYQQSLILSGKEGTVRGAAAGPQPGAAAAGQPPSAAWKSVGARSQAASAARWAPFRRSPPENTKRPSSQQKYSKDGYS